MGKLLDMNQQNKSDALEILIILAMFLLVVVILVYVVYRLIQYFRARPVAISPALLHDVLKPGTYKGVGEYTPTKSHSDGIVTTNVATIEKGEHNSIHYTNTLTAKNKKTNQVVYNAIRKGDFFYKSNLFHNLLPSE